MKQEANNNPRENHSRIRRCKGAVMPLFGMLTALLLITACGEENGSASAAASAVPAEQAAQSESPGVDVSAARTPEEIGQAVADVYVQAFDDLADALASHPDEPQALELMREIRERHIEDLIALGRKIVQLSPSEKATVEAAVRQVQSKLTYDPEIKPIYERYTALNRHYIDTGAMSSNSEFRQLFSSFNILTQYAFFDLLKAQNPEEAERLGF